jgi:hypothetical protein
MGYSKEMRRTKSKLESLRCGLFALLRSEAGIALPTALTTTALALGLGSVAAVSAISSQSGSTRDMDAKLSLAAADAGAERAVYRYNRVETTPTAPCLTATAGQTTGLAGDGWCPAVTGSVDGATYSYRVMPSFVDGDADAIDVVSTGTSDDVSRTIELSAEASSSNPFGDFQVIADDGVVMDSNSAIDANVASNGSFTLNSNTQVCGVIQVPPGASVDFNGTAGQCDGYGIMNGNVDLPLVNQGNVVTVNSNARFFGQDIRSSDRVTWNPATRALSMGSNSSLTLGGANYSFCTLTMASNTTIYIAAGANVRVYFDSPENCGQSSGVVQMNLSSNSQITTTGGSAAAAAFLFVGSPNLATAAHLSSNTSLCNFEVILYGPLTDFTLNSNTNVCGGVAGKTVHMDSNSHVGMHPGLDNFELPIPTHFEPTRYVECGPGTGSTPDSGC